MNTVGREEGVYIWGYGYPDMLGGFGGWKLTVLLYLLFYFESLFELLLFDNYIFAAVA